MPRVYSIVRLNARLYLYHNPFDFQFNTWIQCRNLFENKLTWYLEV